MEGSTKMSPKRRSLIWALSLAGGAAICAALLAASASAARPARAGHGSKPAIVLVHGAFGDAAGWQRVIPILQRDGYEVTAVENPLESLAGDVATTRRVVQAQRGPVVLVGHSYGGAVITGAAAGNPNVRALVYIAAFAPLAGEPLSAPGQHYPAELANALRADEAGFLTIDRRRFRDLFAADVPVAQAAVMAAAQKPIHGDAFGASVAEAAWESIPSWYLVAARDHALNPDLQRFYASRIRAHVTQVQASHAVFVSHPIEVARIIEQAATAAARQSP
jgi:pimeloyl-ACP methyl ester carboxylesterase